MRACEYVDENRIEQGTVFAAGRGKAAWQVRPDHTHPNTPAQLRWTAEHRFDKGLFGANDERADLMLRAADRIDTLRAFLVTVANSDSDLAAEAAALLNSQR